MSLHVLISSTNALSMSSQKECDVPKKVVVIGAIGNTGYRPINLLHKSTSYKPIAMIREASQAHRFEQSGVQIS